MIECLIALGGNIGDVGDTFAAALGRLAAHPDIDISAVSRCFVTEPVGEDAGAPYLNAAAALSTAMEPARLLETTKEIEISLGRPADHATWAPRSVDLDLVTFGDLVLEEERLRVPHPGCWYRRFVLDPVCRIAGSTRHPAWQLTFDQLRERLMARPLPVWLDMDDRRDRIAEWSGRFPEIEWVADPAAVEDCGLALPGNPRPPDPLVDVLTAATGSVELAEEIPGWPERKSPTDTSPGSC
ncbi:MAG: 2-amino-4-hydroxy-6-hydroxymethyldihydropteridine diphosphokinase [Planctomycetaceae bacterium]|nr:2-amino-4-hydroxy-6-hydroxymethyldihydropteridine diphosphokinase [Planctomycetaceae bacterium]